MDADLISLVNKLQDTFNAIGGETVDLPQIVVVGSQSSGKSSVLETIVGRDFLPRGSGIVTRRPLILQLVHLPPSQPAGPPSPATGVASSYASLPTSSKMPVRSGRSTPNAPGGSPNLPAAPFPPAYNGSSSSSAYSAPAMAREYGEFLHTDKRFYDFAEMRREVEQETFRVCGQNKGVSRLPINLKVYSERVLNLTLVDLPGLTKIAIGDQPSDIERQIRSLVLDYISKPNCVILAVSPANVDLANSDALKLARSVDPQGRRTIGVLTKLDLMDAGTNALDILTGRVYPLKLGFIGVVNRSQADINNNKSISDAIDAEADYFRNHPGYRNIAHRCGTKYLAKTLNQVLLGHIRDKLPDMKARLNTLMGQTQQELNAFGDSAFLGEQHRGSLILKLMTQFVRDFTASIDGTSFEISTKELCGGARIYYIFNDVFGHALESINPTQNLTIQDIRTAIRNSTGPRPSLFVPEVAFDLLVKPQIKLLEPPSLRCVELVYEELMKICHNCTSTELQRYPRLHAQLIEVVSELLRERLGPTSEYVTSLIAIQAAYINTNHPNFVSGSIHPEPVNHHHARSAPAAASAVTRKRQQSEGKMLPHEDVVLHSSEEDDDAVTGLPNGSHRPASAASDKGRSMSSSVHDRSAANRSVPGASLLQPSVPPSAEATHANVQQTAKDSFLNYFFGGQAAQHNAAVSRPRSAPGYGDFDHHRADNPLTGRRGLEGSAAAFDMKSLEKHLEAAPLDPTFHMTDREEMETTLIRSLISSYFSIVRQTIQDTVPKAIMHLLVNFSRESIQTRLVSSLYKEPMFADLLYEDESLTAERKRVAALLDAYRKAFQVLSSA
ncbi:uncharacterized protein L969DRAFT_47175 [Mixia osmundae IAM 14324]|uniref:dynamin GTPase n=1 Tax=Mixia osmundae (strain CBS 9802 / IAM 14324 / JCM 22182 / KY 12970) TaxID=764103 RepID=G7E958_MIXOS|nr:uncharacterized protein L969DRAFT_47175 [Mixia osmundae IAM 14324]KEI39797.1 hypothetical protein L969DRAFT_47175 [Mixia osmundae IAM 14324]GAA99177.1 hypothetical protein E5Q_05869 [Mixia osmundae IAM 14324]